ncbi:MULTISPECIES: ABC transporter permease [Microbacterium]|jgi:peptide/nickel transport system permease protein|uniref:Oligopeptide transport system permease protein OppC n=2 Tax=Microbacterium paraoxydans TaxID=199592 RepID=A0A1H1MT10_9MICO|nr:MULTISPECIES: ABC transporter permease [Microbacterium]MCT2223572.1 ABC transporter permease [Microbacterium paraoxydans]OIJ32124.1 peptide ABC transporter permease [Microbacterium sp. LCT-H2]SDR90033.1 peptide/nickel transport system permease protein [Microbacterium paraoxydans]
MTTEMIDPLVEPPVGPPQPADKSLSKWTLYTRRFLRNKPAVGGIIVLFVLILFATLGPLLSRYAVNDMDFLALSSPPSADHWFGTNGAGNDTYTQTAVGLQRSLMIAITVSLGTTILSALVGTAAAYFGGWFERIALLVIHFMMVVPTFLILSVVSNDSGGVWWVIALVMIFVGWFFPARIIWTMALSLREREYVQAARYMGVRGGRIVLRHLVPNIGSLLVINFTLGIVAAVTTETGLSFIGFGVKIPDVSLGSLIGEGSTTITSSPWLFYFPALVLTLLTVSMALIADGLRDALDPTSAAGGRA